MIARENGGGGERERWKRRERGERRGRERGKRGFAVDGGEKREMGDRDECMMAMGLMRRSDFSGEEDVQLAQADAEEPRGEGGRRERGRWRCRIAGRRRSGCGGRVGAGNERWCWDGDSGDVDGPFCVVYIVF